MNMKTALITGAYGGMGRALAERLSRLGYRVYALDKFTESSDNENIIPLEADVSDGKSVEAAISKIDGKISVLVQFAGIYMLDSLVEMSEEAFERIFDINLKGVFLVNKAILPKLSRGG